MPFDPIRAENCDIASSAVLPCGCVAVVLTHDANTVQFGIKDATCRQHADGEMISLEKTVLVRPVEPNWPGAP